MEAVLNSALPFFALIFCGYGAGRLRLISAEGINGVNRFVFYFALPTLLFVKLAEAPIREQFDWRYVAAYAGCGLAVFVAAGGVGRLIWRHSLGEMSVQGLAAAFPNVGYMGLPLVIFALGDRAALPGVLALVSDNVVLLALASALVEISQHGRDGHPLAVAARVLKSLTRHPLIVAIVIGGAYALSGLPLPRPAAAFGTILAGAAGPCALFALGATLVNRPVSSGTGEVAYIAVIKLLVHPALVWLVMAWWLRLDPPLVAVGVLQASMPVAASVFVMAQQYGVYVARCSTAIMATTLLAVLSVSILVAHFAG